MEVMLDTLSPPRRRLVLALVAMVVVGLGAAAIASVRSGAAEEFTPVAQETPGAVLLVPGYGGSTDSLEALAAVLTQDGRDVVLVETPGDGTGDLGVQAEALDNAAKHAIEDTGVDSVDVVGYSAGGVVARLWVGEYGGDSLARRVVTLGSPHHGTDLAGLASDLAPDECPTACRQLSPSSDLLRRLNAGDETPAGPVFVSLWTRDDQTVTPPSSADLDGALNIVVQDVCDVGEVTHGALPSTESVMALVVLEIGRTPPVEPAARNCELVSS